MSLIKNIPIPIAGVMLALLSLGNLVQDIHPYLRYLFAFLGIIILILLILKVILYPQEIKDDFKNPVIVSSSGTFSMGVMLLSTYVLEFMPSIGYTIWIIGIVLHILLMIYFTHHFIIRDFDISTVYPSYWIVFIGITMAAITSQAHQIQEIGFIFFIAGFIAMIVTFPLIIYRYVNYSDIPDMNKPLICIFNAVMSILIVGYVNSAQSINLTLLMILYGFACIFYIFALYKLIEYRNLEFYPSFAAFTFPFVISTLATKSILKIVGENSLLNAILTLETAVALIVVLYVLVRYIKFFKKVESRN